MGLGGISLTSLLVILLIVVVIFGTKKLRSIGGDLGGAVKSFRSAMEEGEKELGEKEQEPDPRQLDDGRPDATFEAGDADSATADKTSHSSHT